MYKISFVDGLHGGKSPDEKSSAGNDPNGKIPNASFTNEEDPLGMSYAGAVFELDDLSDKRKSTIRRGSDARIGNLRQLNRQESVAQLLTEEQEDAIYRYTGITRFQFFFFVLPMFISLWYSAAVLFPPEARQGKWSLVLWTPGNLIKKEDGSVSLCPKASICSEGVFQIMLISISRLTAFASYVTMGITFGSKMHSLIHFLSSTYLSTYIPFQSMHEVHKHLGFIYCLLAVLHTIGHLIRWIVRKEMGTRSATQVAISGYIAMAVMIVVIGSMSSYAKKYKSIMTFERRFKLHWFFNILIAALCFHTTRTMIISLCFGGMWFLDYTYGRVFRTHRLDVVEFTPLKEMAGCQMLWRNPEGFKAKSGEYIKVRLPWMEGNGKEWHPFSLYLREATQQGLEEIARETREVQTEIKREAHRSKLKKNGKVFNLKSSAQECVEIDSYKTALLLFGLQNEVISSDGKLHSAVKEGLKATNMIEKLELLIQTAREEGVQIIHLPLIVDEDQPTSKITMLSHKANSQFIKGSWGAEFFSAFEPKSGDLTIDKGFKETYFDDTDLQPFIERNNIDTLIFAGFTLNGVLETTMFKANDLNFNIISLSDGTAGRDLEEHVHTCESLFELHGPVLSCEVVKRIIDGEAPDYHEARRASMEHLGPKPPAKEPSLQDFIVEYLYKPAHEDDNEDEESLILKEAREDLSKRFNTSQIFIAPQGDWTKKVNRSVRERAQQQSCWISGPYTSPYHVATRFRHIILSASGIGITPALGVMGQYPGNTKTKILVWMTRSKVMLKFFAPLLKDCHLAVVFYTGKDKLSSIEIHNIHNQGKRNIFIQQTRPKSLEQILETIVVQFENSFELALTETEDGYGFKSNRTLDAVMKRHREEWCLLYCGGSVTVEQILKNFAKKHGFGWDSEFFNW